MSVAELNADLLPEIIASIVARLIRERSHLPGFARVIAGAGMVTANKTL